MLGSWGRDQSKHMTGFSVHFWHFCPHTGKGTQYSNLMVLRFLHGSASDDWKECGRNAHSFLLTCTIWPKKSVLGLEGQHAQVNGKG